MNQMPSPRSVMRDPTPQTGGRGTADAAPERDILEVSGRGPDDAVREGRSGEPAGRATGGREGKPPAPPPKTVFVIAGLALAAAIGWGGYTHWRSYQDSAQTTSDVTDRAVDVRTTEAKRIDGPLDLTLPGETQAYDTASLYPRATGYISERRVDIGARVKKDDLLLHISAPELDQQLAQAEAQIGQTRAAFAQAQAQVGQAEANLNLAKITFARANQLTQQGFETLQNHDNQQANLQTQQANVESAKAGVRLAEANVQAQQATIDRLKALTSFEDVRAPFDGVITARNVDTGDLVNADLGSAQPMFTIARDDVIRVMVRIPQNDAVGVRDGLQAKVVVPQTPDRQFSGTVQRSSVALLYSSRTLTTEVDVANEDGALRPGLYVSVSLAIPRDRPDVNIPAEALIFNQHGMQVASVADNKIRLHEVNIYRDHGTSVDVREGLKGGERIVLSPPATLKDGMDVHEKTAEAETKPDDGQAAQNKAN